MTLPFDPKEDLRLRMIDLERKLAESEEERYKLEKTCNVLMRAFKEEEKMRYKTLNKNYEKFLQDCTVRKRRNDIIMRSLCRIEDRSRAFYAKTERLKLLKDRYFSYLKISDIKSGAFSQIWGTSPPNSIQLPKTNDEAPAELGQWKNPLEAGCKIANLKHFEDNSIWNSKTFDISSHNSVMSPEKWKEKDMHSRNDCKTIICDEISRIETPARSYAPQNKLCLVKTRFHSPENLVNSEDLTRTINKEKPVHVDILKNNVSSEGEIKDLVEVTVFRERNNLNHEESVEKLKKALSSEEQFSDNENNRKRHDMYDKKDDDKQSDENPAKKQIFGINYCVKTSSSRAFEGKNQGHQADNFQSEMKSGSPEKNLPMGLDGIDYQNETYPESYYEQPVHHHNHTSIVADVILEEDETEQDVNEEKKNICEEDQMLPEDYRLGTNSPDHGTDKPFYKFQQNWKNEVNNKSELIDKVRDLSEKAVSDVRSQESNSEKLSEGKSSDIDCSEKSEKLSKENLERKKNVRSNLIHLLESDSESFQIEHGDAISGNEDSDFDFSFH